MKKYCLMLLLLLAAWSARAQFVGDISVVRKKLSARDGELTMVLEIRVRDRAVTRSQSLVIIPELSTADRRSVKLFPHILIEGPYQRHMRERRRVLTGRRWMEREPYRTIEAVRGTDETIHYEMKVPYEPWMEQATLVIRQILTSADRSQHIATIDVNGAVERP